MTDLSVRIAIMAVEMFTDRHKDKDIPPKDYMDVFETDGARYKTLYHGTVSGIQWINFLELLKHKHADIDKYLIESEADFKYEVRLEYLEENSKWCYVLYATFKNEGAALVFYMWINS